MADNNKNKIKPKFRFTKKDIKKQNSFIYQIKRAIILGFVFLNLVKKSK